MNDAASTMNAHGRQNAEWRRELLTCNVSAWDGRRNRAMGDWACSDDKHDNDLATATWLRLEVW